MSKAPVRPAASTPEALHAIIVDAFNRGDVDAFLAAHEEGASVVIPPGGTCAHGLDEIRAATAPIIALRPRMTSVVYKTLRSNELALTHASWDLDGTAPDGTRTQLSGTGTIVSRRGPDGTWRIVLDDPQSGAAAEAARVIYGKTRSEAAIRAEHQILVPALSRPQLAAAPLPGSTPRRYDQPSGPGQAVGIYGKEDIHERY